MEDPDFNEAEYEALMQRVDERFPNCPFSICVNTWEELDEVVDDIYEQIVLHCDHNCYCYSQCPRPNVYIIVRRKPNKNYITYADCVEEMMKQEYDPACNHCMLEGFMRRGETCSYDPCFGS